jgi:hypothetical protein
MGDKYHYIVIITWMSGYNSSELFGDLVKEGWHISTSGRTAERTAPGSMSTVVSFKIEHNNCSIGEIHKLITYRISKYKYYSLVIANGEGSTCWDVGNILFPQDNSIPIKSVIESTSEKDNTDKMKIN